MASLRGVLNVNKPSGVSSYDVIRRLKPLLASLETDRPGRTAVGHAGTLDPLASGVLPVLIGAATKISRLLLSLPKEYVAGVLFGRQTDTDDITGRVIGEQPVTGLTAQRIQDGLVGFTGEIEQTPPAFSALKQDGQPLYRLARQGLPLHPRPRRVKIHELELLDWTSPRAVMRCRVSAGTYIRALARDLGARLGALATLESLARTKVGHFRVEDAVAVEELSAAMLLERLTPIDAALVGWPTIAVSRAEALRLRQGQPLRRPDQGSSPMDSGLVVATTQDRSFLALVVSTQAELRTERLIYAD